MKKLFLKTFKCYFKCDECSWDIISEASLGPKVNFGLWPLLWPNWAIFDFDGHFIPLNGGKDRKDFVQSFPWA